MAPHTLTSARFTYPLLLNMLFALSTLALATLASAETPSWYLSAKTSIAAVSLDDTDAAGSIGTNQSINGQLDGAIQDVDRNDYTAGVGVALGRRWQQWSVEAEYVYRYRTDWDVVAPTPSIQTITNIFSNVETHSLVLNVMRHGQLSDKWGWEAGLGIGWVDNTVEAQLLERATEAVAEFTTTDTRSSSDVVYTALLGVTRELNSRMDLNIRYRYLPLGDLEAGPFSNRNARLTGEHSAHEVQFALVFNL